MATAGLRIGDQLVLEEDYDENYIPSEQESCVLDPDCPEDLGSLQTEDGEALKGFSGEMLLRLLNLASRRQRPF